MKKAEAIKKAAFRASVIIKEAGGSVPVLAFHEIFDDVSYDDCRWPFSKMAATVMDEMAASGVAKIACDRSGYSVNVNDGLVDFFGELNKTAEPIGESKRPGMLKEASDRWRTVLGKYAELEDTLDRRYDPTPEPVAVQQAPPPAPLPAPQKPTFDQVREMELWSSWKRTGNQAALNDLLSRYEPLIRRGASTFYAAPIPKSVLDAEAKSAAISAFHNYDPKQGVKLSTFVMSYMPKIRRFVNQHQNVGYIPEVHTLKIGRYNLAVKELSEENGGRSPSAAELADNLGWHMDDVKKMRKLLRKDLIAEQPGTEGVAVRQDPRMDIFMDYLYRELSGQDKAVFEHIYGWNGAEKLEHSAQIAEKMNISESTVNRSKARISAIADHHARNFEDV